MFGISDAAPGGAVIGGTFPARFRASILGYASGMVQFSWVNHHPFIECGARVALSWVVAYPNLWFSIPFLLDYSLHRLLFPLIQPFVQVEWKLR